MLAAQLKKPFQNQQGIGIIGIIILLALIYAAVTVYSYFNPDFSVARYTPTVLIRNLDDERRKSDLVKIANALDNYYDKNSQLPGSVGYCGRIVSILNPEAMNALSPYFPGGIPQDPRQKGTHEDYFYRYEDTNTYILMAVLSSPPAGARAYNFSGCHDWPGDNIYNYAVTNS